MFYDSAIDSDMLNIKFVLKKNGKRLFTRKGKHWWLTGFRLGEFSNPDDLTMKIEITLKTKAMLRAFMKGLQSTGYKREELSIKENIIALEFNKPKTKQPFTRNEKTEKIILNNTKALCETYQDITQDYDGLPEKVAAIKLKAPQVYKHIINIGKNDEIFWNHDIINLYKERHIKNYYDRNNKRF